MGPSVMAAFESVPNDAKYSNPIRRRPVWVQTDRGMQFLNRSFQDMLKREGIQFHVCMSPDVKFAAVERAHQTLRNKLYSYFNYKFAYGFVDVLQQFVKAYNTNIQRLVWLLPL